MSLVKCLKRHSRESGNPLVLMGLSAKWIPAFAGMTVRLTKCF